MHCQITQVFQMQLLVIQFTVKMFHIGFMQVLNTIVSSLGRLKSIHCQITQVFQMQLLVIQFTVKMFHIGFMQVFVLGS